MNMVRINLVLTRRSSAPPRSGKKVRACKVENFDWIAYWGRVCVLSGACV